MKLDYFVRTAERRTFTYYKPLVVRPNSPPVELNRLDIKNWTPTSSAVQEAIVNHLRSAASLVDGIVVMDELGDLVGSDDAEEGTPTARAVLTRRLTDAKRRRRVARRGAVEEEDEPVA